MTSHTSPADAPIWQAICTLLHIDPHSRGALDAAHTALHEAVGRGTLQRIKDGVEPRVASLNKIADALGVDRASLLTPAWHTTRETRAEYGGIPTQIAQDIAAREKIALPKKYTWEGLMKESIEGQFTLPIADDALAPSYMPGQGGIWQAGASARAGQPVLIWLPGDRFVVRFYEQRGPSWAGVSERVGHKTITPQEDGAEIVARLVYVALE